MVDLLFTPHLFIVLLIALVVVLPFWQIFKKAGHAPAMSLLMMVPLVNFAVLFIFAFSDWPALRELRRLKGETPAASNAPVEPK